MRESRRCPKCEGTKIGHFDFRSHPIDVRVRSHLSVTPDATALPISRLDTYVCGTCGYIEEYVADVSELNEEQWGFRWLEAPEAQQPYR